MSEVVGSSVSLVLFLLLTSATFLFQIDSWTTHSLAAEAATNRRVERLHPNMDITSVVQPVTGCGTFSATVGSAGRTSVSDFSQMDVLVDYTDGADAKVVLHLTNKGDWSVTALSPDTYDTNIWNPQESATIIYAAVPPPKSNTQGTVIIGSPQGVTASAYFSTASAENCYYLHNNPTPPTGATSSQASLPLTTGPALEAILYNYDQDRDAQTGLLIVKGGTDENEADSTKHQTWRTGVLSSPLALAGTVTIDFWSAIKDFTLSTAGAVTFYLRDYDGSSYSEIANGTVSKADWQGGVANFVAKTLSIGSVDYTVSAENQLELKLIVGAASGDDMWFAYDATGYPAVVKIP